VTDSNQSSSGSRRRFLAGSATGLVLGALAGYAGGRLQRREVTCLGEALPEDATASEYALRDLLDTINLYEQAYLYDGAVNPSEQDLADGHRYLFHLLTTGVELFLEGDPGRPEFAQIVSPTRKLMGDNADAYYFHAMLDPAGRYRVWGTNTGEVYTSITVHSGDTPGGWATGVVGSANHLEFSDHGSGRWSVELGREASGPGTLQTSADTVSIISRHYYLNDTYAAADPDINPRIRIERLDPLPPPDPLSDQAMAQRIRALEQFLRANSLDRPLMNPLTTPDWFSLIPNTLGQPEAWTPDGAGGWGAVDNAYSAGMFRLEEDEALVIRGTMPKCVFSSVLLWNKYLATFDYRYRQISLNKRQMTIADDGSFTIIVAHRDPGLPNWLDTEGRGSGIVYWRFLMPEGELAGMETEVVPLGSLTD
jgi:hypothetical protein